MLLQLKQMKNYIYYSGNKAYLITVILIYFLLTVKGVTLIFISGRGSAISSAKQGKSDSICNSVKNN